MPISTIASYLSTMQEFITHWTAVNTDLGLGGPLVLTGGYAVGSLTLDRTGLEAKIIAVEPALNTLQAAANTRDNLKGPMRERVRQFRAFGHSFLKGSQYIRALPLLPKFTASPGDFMRALDDMSNLWTTINATPPLGFTPPLKLQGGYLVAGFNLDVAAMRAAFQAWDAGTQTVAIVRGQRDMLLPPIPPRLAQYRQAVIATYPPGHALVQSLPAIRPAPGSTPHAVQLSGLWSDALGKAHLQWSISDNAQLDHYSIRSCDPPRYRAVDEATVSNVAAGTQEFDTDLGLSAPGSAKIFKVYVVTVDDNEKGSNAVKVTHPE
jgi:hypothetical protein